MSQHICPQCGSTYLSVDPGRRKQILQVKENFQPVIIDASEKVDSPLNAGTQIYCCSCRWKGEVAELSISDLED